MNHFLKANMKKIKNTTVVNGAVKESIKDQTASRKLSIKTIFFSILAVGIGLMIVAYLYSFMRMGESKGDYSFGKEQPGDTVSVSKRDTIVEDGE